MSCFVSLGLLVMSATFTFTLTFILFSHRVGKAGMCTVQSHFLRTLCNTWYGDIELALLSTPWGFLLCACVHEASAHYRSQLCFPFLLCFQNTSSLRQLTPFALFGFFLLPFGAAFAFPLMMCLTSERGSGRYQELRTTLFIHTFPHGTK